MSERNCRIIIVDDESELALNLQDILQDKGYETVVAHDGAAALGLCREGDFDLGLVDISLPDLAGESLIQSIAEIRPGMEFIIVTGRGTLESAAYAVSQKNIIAYEIKPLDVERLVLLIDQIFRRKQAEGAFKSSEQLLGTVLDNIYDAFWSADLSGQFDYLSPILETIYGRSIAEMMANPNFWMEATHPEDRGRVCASGETLMRDGRVEIEYRCIRPNGKVRWIVDRKIIIRDENGNPLRIVGVLNDITERKQSEEALRASEAKYRNLIETTSTGFLVLDGHGLVVDANAEYVRMSGHSELSEILGRNVIEWTAAHSREKNVAAVDRCLQDGFVKALEINYAGADGRITPIEIDASVLGSGDDLRIISLCRDITNHKQVENELKESLERLSIATSAGKIGVWDWNIEKNELVWDDSMYSLYGIKMEDFEGAYDAWTRLLHPDDRQFADGEIQAAIRGEREYDQEFRIVQPDGTVRILQAASQTIRDQHGKALRMTGTNIDITERKQADEVLRESESRLNDIVHSTADWVWEVDKNGVYTYCSDKSLNILGRSTSDIIGKTPFDFMPPDEKERVAAIFSEIMANKEPMKDVENWNTTASGERICLLTNGVPILDKEENLIGYRGVDKDITRDKLAYEALQKSDASLKYAQRVAQVGSWELDVQTHRLLWSDETYRVFGMQREDFDPTMETFFELVYPDDIAMMNAVTQAALYEGKEIDVEHRIIRSTGEVRTVHEKASVIFDDAEQPIRMIGTIQDVTEHKQVEKDKLQFYSDTITSVTQGKLNLVSFGELKTYLDSAELVCNIACSDNIVDTRHNITKFCSEKGLCKDRLELFESAIGEAMANAVKHAPEGLVYAGTRNNSIWVAVSDNGPGMSTFALPHAILRRGFSTKASMGMGFTIMMEATDSIMLCTGSQGTTIILSMDITESRPVLTLDDFPDTW